MSGDLKCPGCGETVSFRIDCRMTVQIDQEGEKSLGAPDWDEDSEITCTTCGHEGAVSEFRPSDIPVENILLRARELCALGASTDDIVVYDDAEPDEVEDGYWVNARVFVRKEDL